MPYTNKEQDKEYQRTYQREYRRKRYNEDPDFKQQQNERQRKSYAKYAEQRRAYRNEHYQKNRERDIESRKQYSKDRRDLIGTIKLHYGCMNPGCKWNGPFDQYCLDFHHLDPSKKEFQLNISASVKRLMSEVRKCVVLCAICHRMETNGTIDVSNLTPCQVDDEGNILLDH